MPETHGHPWAAAHTHLTPACVSPWVPQCDLPPLPVCTPTPAPVFSPTHVTRPCTHHQEEGYIPSSPQGPRCTPDPYTPDPSPRAGDDGKAPHGVPASLPRFLLPGGGAALQEGFLLSRPPL